MLYFLDFCQEAFVLHIIDPLKKKYNVKVYSYSLKTKSNKLKANRDEEKDIIINLDHKKLIKFDIDVYEYQEDIQLDDIKCKTHYHALEHKNFIRSIYQEAQFIKNFKLEGFDSCVMLSNESLYINQINYEEIEYSINNNCCYTRSFLKYGGTADGFYICKPDILKKICCRYYDIIAKDRYCLYNYYQNSEGILKNTFKLNNIDDRNSTIYCLKVRANGKFSNEYTWYSDSYKFIKNIEKYVDKEEEKKIIEQFWHK